MNKSTQEAALTFGGIAFGVIGILLLWNIWCAVSVGNIGVLTTFGSISNYTLSSGFHFKNPFSLEHDMPISMQTTTTKSEAASSDLQNVDTTVVLNYTLSAKDLINTYVNFTDDMDAIKNNIVMPAINETFKAVVSRYTAEELINKRALVSNDIQSTLQAKLLKNGILIQNVNITSFSFSQVFNQAIEAKITAQQRVLTAQNDLARIQIEAEQKIVRAKAEADALNLQKLAITPELIELRQVENNSAAINKWDGHLPQYTGNGLPFIMNK